MSKLNPVQIQKFLQGINYPATKEDLIQYAEEEGIGEKVLSLLAQLPNKNFQSPADVSQEMHEAEK